MQVREVWSSVQAQLWDIWVRNREAGRWLLGVMACLFALEPAKMIMRLDFPLISFVDVHLVGAAGLLALTIFACTEFNSQDDTRGFPRRLFVLPVSTLQLVAVPMITGAAVTELVLVVCMAWARSLEHADWNISLLVLAPVYVVVYQAILWTLPWLRSMRVLIVGIVGIFFILAPVFSFYGSAVMRGGSMTPMLEFFVALGIAAFLLSWICVARQRSGGGSVSVWVASWASAEMAFPKPEKLFRSAEAAQEWFEWRRSGSVLPGLIGSLLIVVIGPSSWYARHAAGTSLLIFLVTLAMPILLALPIGKAFSKPDFWSSDLGIPPIVAVRPLGAADMVAIKMKVAAKSAALAWAYALVFLGIWLPLWADRTRIDRAGLLIWVINGHSVYRQYGIAALSVLIGILLTWRLLIGSLWLGLQGNQRLFTFSAALAYGFVPFFAFVGVVWVATHQTFFFGWLQRHLDSLLLQLEWLAAFAILLKVCATVWSWRKIPTERLRAYFFFWVAGTLLLIGFAVMVWSGLPPAPPAVTYRIRTLMILMAIMFLPLARIGLASSSFEKNRHRF
jgi:hypothetical protein